MKPSEKVALGLALEELERPKAAERVHARAACTRNLTACQIRRGRTGKVYDLVGEAVGMSALRYHAGYHEPTIPLLVGTSDGFRIRWCRRSHLDLDPTRGVRTRIVRPSQPSKRAARVNPSPTRARAPERRRTRQTPRRAHDPPVLRAAASPSESLRRHLIVGRAACSPLGDDVAF